jgi:hypothetical protein
MAKPVNEVIQKFPALGYKDVTSEDPSRKEVRGFTHCFVKKFQGKSNAFTSMFENFPDVVKKFHDKSEEFTFMFERFPDGEWFFDGGSIPGRDINSGEEALAYAESLEPLIARGDLKKTS